MKKNCTQEEKRAHRNTPCPEAHGLPGAHGRTARLPAGRQGKRRRRRNRRVLGGGRWATAAASAAAGPGGERDPPPQGRQAERGPGHTAAARNRERGRDSPLRALAVQREAAESRRRGGDTPRSPERGLAAPRRSPLPSPHSPGASVYHAGGQVARHAGEPAMRALRHHPGRRRRLPRPGPARPQCMGGGAAAGTMQPPVSAAPRAHAPPAAAT